jgi:CHRD domain
MSVLAAIRADTVYVNLSSDRFPAGEIRGQLKMGDTGNAGLDSGIEGKVTVGPVCPGAIPDPPDPNCADRPYQSVVVVKAADGQKLLSRPNSLIK